MCPRTKEQFELIRENKKEQIILAAIECFGTQGYYSVTISQLAKYAGISKGLLYNYYASKDELLIAIHKKAFIMLYDKINYDVEMTDTPLDRCKKMAYAFVEFGTNNINIYDIMFNRPIRQHSDYIGTPQEEISFDEFRSSLKGLFYAIKIIKEYRETRPNLNPVDPKFLAIQSISALHGIISLQNSGILYQISDDPDITLKTIIDNAMSCVTG